MAQKTYRPMRMRRWRTFRELENTERRFLEDLDRFVEGNFPSLSSLRNWLPGGERPWVPMAEVYEANDKVIVRVELPGVNPDDVDIMAEGDSIVVKGERKPEEGVDSEQYHECERCYGKFYRRVLLPEEADPSKIEASFDKGMLEITIGRVKAAKASRIKIKKS